MFNNQCVERAEAEELPWDSLVLGMKCARVSHMEETGSSGLNFVPADFYRPLVEGFKRQNWEYVIVRRPAGEWRRFHLLENVGFHYLDQILGFRLVNSVSLTRRQAQAHLRVAQSADESLVAELSARTFVRSRFHNDPLLTKEQCEMVYRQWGANSVRGQAAQCVWLAERDKQVVGFITLNSKTEGKAPLGIIDLIGVLPQFSGQGLGSALVARGVEWFSSRGIQQVLVQTQGDNLAAIQLYTRMGFKPDYAQVTWRWSSRHE